MPAVDFLQQFHNLAEADGEVRSRAAFAVRRGLRSRDGTADRENLAYTVKRLVRGVQSSRQCARQGFAVALAELLAAFPDELGSVLQLTAQLTELQSGLKAGEQKDRMLGRLFVYAAVLQAGCLRPAAGGGKGKAGSVRTAVADLGRGLHELYAARPYLRTPAAVVAAGSCRELCAAGLAGEVAHLLEAWALDEKVQASGEEVDTQGAGLVLDLRVAYEEAELAGAGASLASWPACVRKDSYAKPGPLGQLVRALGRELSACQLGDAVPFALAPFCRWWLRSSETRRAAALQSHIWPALDDTLFPDKASLAAQAHGLRAVGEIVSAMCAASRQPNALPPAESERLLVGLFEQMPRGMDLFLRTLASQRLPTHPAALFTHTRLVGALGKQGPQGHGKRPRRHGAGAETPDAPLLAVEMEVSDDARLAILGALQQHRAFGALSGHVQRQWHQALLAPLSPSGVRLRCAALLAGIRGKAGEKGATEPANARVCAAQLEQLTAHARAPDEVILAVLCALFTAAYLEPASAEATPRLSFRSFCASTGFPVPQEGEDLVIQASSSGADTAPQAQSDRALWRSKCAAAIAALIRRPLPDMAEKLAQKGAAGQDGTQDAGAAVAVRTHAFHGCMSDGSLLIMRLHDWWDHVTAQSPDADDVAPPKKKKARKGGGALRCAGVFDEQDSALRSRCLAVCRRVLDPANANAKVSARQRNALCGLPLCMLLALLGMEKGPERSAFRETVEEVVSAIEKFADAPQPAQAGKQQAKALRQQADILAVVPRVAAELFVNTTSLAKEAARTAWRELGEFAPDETVTSICASIRDLDEPAGKDEDGEGSGPDDEDEEEDTSEAALAKAAKFAQATQALKAQREAEAAARTGADGDEEEDDEDVLLDTEGMLQQLLGSDDEGTGASGGLLASFASSGLEGAEAAGQKLTKRQQRLRQRHADVTRKFRELDLLESFISHLADRRPVVLQLLQDLHQALVLAYRRAARSAQQAPAAGEEPEASAVPKKAKKKTRADVALRQLEATLAQRIAKLLSRTLKHVCRGSSVSAVSAWHTAEEWAGLARALFALGANPKTPTGQQRCDVGALLLYLFCAAQRAALRGHGADGARETGAEEGWALAEELLTAALHNWTSKRDCEKWSEAVLATFAARVPHLIIGLPWLESMRASAARKAFVQRAQMSFFTAHVLHGSHAGVTPGRVASIATGFAELCAELLRSTVESKAADPAAASAAQKQKLRREALRGLKSALRARKKDAQVTDLPEALVQQVVATVTKVRDALPARHGEIYQLCLHLLRTLQPVSKGSASGEAGGAKAAAAKQPSAGDGEPAAKEDSPREAKRRKVQAAEQAAVVPEGGGEKAAGKKSRPAQQKGGPEVARGNKRFFGEM